MFFSTPKDIAQPQNKKNKSISHNHRIICIKGFSEKCFTFSDNVNSNWMALEAVKHSST